MIVLDRIEGGRAIFVVEGGQFEIAAGSLPPGSKEGDVFRLVHDESATIAQKSEAEARLARLRARGNQGPDNMDL